MARAVPADRARSTSTPARTRRGPSRARATTRITDEILTTYYDQDDTVEDAPDIPGVLLSIQDRTTGSESTYVHLAGADGTGGPLHGGGVSTDGEFVYVVGGGTVWVYDRAAIDAAPTGGTVTAAA